MNFQHYTDPNPFPLSLDGFDEQEDELHDVHEGKLDPPTDDEGTGSIDEKNGQGNSLETEDEEDDETDERPYGETHLA